MKITLPPDVLKNLPAPSSDDGLVRATVGIKLGADGSADLVEINDTPLPSGAEEEETPASEYPPEDPAQAADMEQVSTDAASQIQQL